MLHKVYYYLGRLTLNRLSIRPARGLDRIQWSGSSCGRSCPLRLVLRSNCRNTLVGSLVDLLLACTGQTWAS